MVFPAVWTKEDSFKTCLFIGKLIEVFPRAAGKHAPLWTMQFRTCIYADQRTVLFAVVTLRTSSCLSKGPLCSFAWLGRWVLCLHLCCERPPSHDWFSQVLWVYTTVNIFLKTRFYFWSLRLYGIQFPVLNGQC
jgi:hypothetical protein